MRAVAAIVTLMVLSACGLNQPGTNSSDNSANVANAGSSSQELPVVQEPVEAINDQMQSMEQQEGSMEAKTEGESDAAAKEQVMESESMTENMAGSEKESQIPTAEAEVPQDGSASEVEEKKTDLKS